MYMISALVTCRNRSFFQLCLPENILTPLNSNLADFDEDDLYFTSPQNKKKSSYFGFPTYKKISFIV